MAHRTDADLIQNDHNTARFFVENRQVAIIALVGVIIWGVYGYIHMPKRKDPIIPVRVAMAQCPWPGVNAQQVEQLVTRPIEQTIAQNSFIKPGSPSDFGIRSMTFPGLAVVYLQLSDSVKDTKRQFSDINLKLNSLNAKLPQGAGPITFNSDFGDTAALMLTVASPPVSDVEVAVRARVVQKAIEDTRPRVSRDSVGQRVSIVYCFPASVPTSLVQVPFRSFAEAVENKKLLGDVRYLLGSGFVGLDAETQVSDADLREFGRRFVHDNLHRSAIHPDAWEPAIIRDPESTQAQLARVAGEEYTYKDLENYTDLISRNVQGAEPVSKVQRSGVLPEQVYLDYSQDRLASYGLQPSDLSNILNAQNISLPGGQLQFGSTNVIFDPSGQFDDAKAIGNVIVGSGSNNTPVYLRDLVDISRGYQSPPTFLNFLDWQDPSGKWRRSRAVTLAIFMRDGAQINDFGKLVDEKLNVARRYLPDDLVMVRTSDQPLQVKENVDLFMDALYEAIALVVLVSFIGFREWRSALVMAVSIPTTLAMTFGIVYLLGIDIQQVSVASLIIALGLLVDDPVVAGDAIKRSLADGHPPIVAAWLGPTKISRAIIFATITNIVAYLPLLLITGNTGEFLYSLPIVLACSLIASRLVSMTFVPLMGYYLLRRPAKPERTIEEQRTQGFMGLYYRSGEFAMEHRYKFLLGSAVCLLVGMFAFKHLRTSFFPEDVQYWSYVDIWLPNDAPFDVSNDAALKAESIVRRVAQEYGESHLDKDGKPRQILKYVTTFVGGGSPRFWFSVSPQAQQLNYAELLIQVTDKEDTPNIVPLFQKAVSAEIPGALLDVRQLLTNPVNYPLEIRVSAQADVSAKAEAADNRMLRKMAQQVADVLRDVPICTRVRSDWFEQGSTMRLQIDPDRANLAGISNLDVAHSTTAALSGQTVTVLREGDKQIPVVARLRMDQVAQLADIQNLYVYSSQGNQKVPLIQVSDIDNRMETQRIIRLEQFRTISVQAFPIAGRLSSEVLAMAMPKLLDLKRSLPGGYSLQIGGEYDKQQTGFKNLAVALTVSVLMIFLALVVQFNNAIKPLIVFAAAPFGVVGAILALWIMDAPFGFMAFLGIASLIGVIVSHIILFFDFIEEKHEEGEDFEQSVLDAGIVRLRPVLITVSATVLALFPLALHGGPLWQPLCYAQIGGLSVATLVTKLLVPAIYAVMIWDLKIIRWEKPKGTESAAASRPEGVPAD
jgi:multidrug efflux pump subunit AcrB